MDRFAEEALSSPHHQTKSTIPFCIPRVFYVFSNFIQISLIFYLAFFSVPGSYLGYHIIYGHHVFLDSFGLLQFLRLSFLFMTLTVLRSIVQVFYKLFFNLGVPDILIIAKLGLWVWRRNSQHFFSSVDAINMTYHHWCWPLSSGWASLSTFFNVKSFSPFQ